MNRLNLDFTLDSIEDRLFYVEKYLEDFNPTKSETEKIANYLLYGKDKDGKSVVDKKEIEIETRKSTWAKEEAESLDQLLESPTFNEHMLNPINPKRPKKEKFSRELPSNLSTPYKKSLQDLFTRIDETDLLITLYELHIGKRKLPPRQELLDRISIRRQEQLLEKAQKLSPYQYINHKHLLVELRREQYTVRDNYSEPIRNHSRFQATPFTDSPTQILLPYPILDLQKKFTEKEITLLIKHYWENQNDKTLTLFDFTNLEYLYNLIFFFYQIQNSSPHIIEAFNFFRKEAELTVPQEEILDLKIQSTPNSKIAEQINATHSKNYSENYISTIFRQKILKKISETALLYEESFLSLPNPELFKICTGCGKNLLIRSENFTKRKAAADGFSNKCKRCEKKDRERRKLG